MSDERYGPPPTVLTKNWNRRRWRKWMAKYVGNPRRRQVQRPRFRSQRRAHRRMMAHVNLFHLKTVTGLIR